MENIIEDLFISSYFSSKSSLLRGTAQSVDLLGSISKQKRNNFEQQSDRNALRQDWEAVGSDIYKALEVYGQTIQ